MKFRPPLDHDPHPRVFSSVPWIWLTGSAAWQLAGWPRLS